MRYSMSQAMFTNKARTLSKTSHRSLSIINPEERKVAPKRSSKERFIGLSSHSYESSGLKHSLLLSPRPIKPINHKITLNKPPKPIPSFNRPYTSVAKNIVVNRLLRGYADSRSSSQESQ